MPVTTCPFCGSDTGIERPAQPEVASLSLDELETLVRNEWRRRIGPDAYGRSHSRSLIRALIVYALAPESAVRRVVVDELLWKEVATYQTWGLSRAAILLELQRLSEAIVDVLANTTLRVDLRHSLTERIERIVRQTLDWPELSDS